MAVTSNTTHISSSTAIPECNICSLQIYRDQTLLNFRHTSIKTIQQKFPDIQLSSYLICPKILESGWQIRSSTDWQLKNIINQIGDDLWLPVFFNERQPDQYFQQELKLVCILLKNISRYEVFLGYVPGTLTAGSVVNAFADFHSVKLYQSTIYCTSVSHQIAPIEKINRIKIHQLEDIYIKVSNVSEVFQEIDQLLDEQELREYQTQQKPVVMKNLLNYNSQQEKMVNQDDLSMVNYSNQRNQVNTNINQSVQYQQSQQFQQNTYQYQSRAEYRQRIISAKSEHQLSNLRNQVKRKCRSPTLLLCSHIKTQEQMEFQLQQIAGQIRKKIQEN